MHNLKYMLKSLTIFRISDIPAAFLADACWTLLPVFTPCGPTQPASIGWVPPRGPHESDLVETVGGQIILRACIETKNVPAATLAKAVDVKARAVERDSGRKPGKKHLRELKDEARLELLPHAFPRQKQVLVWIDMAAGRLVIGTTSVSTLDAVVTLLVQSLEGIKVHTINTTDAPVAIMTGWLQDGEPDFDGFTLGRACELKAADELKSVVRYSRAPLDTEEVKTYVRQGMRAQSLEVTHRGRVAFTLTTGMQLRGIEFLDVVMEGRDGDVADSFGADVALATGELRQVIDDVVAAMGGEVVVTEGGGE